MDKELIGYTCYYCKKYYGLNPRVMKERICYFDKNEAVGESLLCKDGSDDCSRIGEKAVVNIYKR